MNYSQIEIKPQIVCHWENQKNFVAIKEQRKVRSLKDDPNFINLFSRDISKW